MISEQSVGNLANGEFETTGGTDFNCIVEHAVEKKLDKFIVFTDGYAGISEENMQLAKDKIDDVAIVYFTESDFNRRKSKPRQMRTYYNNVNRDNFLENHYGNPFLLSDLLN